MKYVALLRGINVGTNNQISMRELVALFETLSLKNVKSYINSGNLLFESTKKSTDLALLLENQILKKFSMDIKVLVVSSKTIDAVIAAAKKEHVNTKDEKTDVMFLWKEVDSPKTLASLNPNENIESAQYVKGAIIWNISRKNYSKSKIPKMIGTPLYKQMTIRNINTVRKLKMLMEK